MPASIAFNQPRRYATRLLPGCTGGMPRGTGCKPWLAAIMVLTVRLAPAQEALRNSLAGEAAAAARHVQLQSLPYTYKSGDLRVLVTPSVGLDLNDNVNTSKTDAESDVILRPFLQLSLHYPITHRNLL